MSAKTIDPIFGFAQEIRFLLVLLPFLVAQDALGVAAAYGLGLHPLVGLLGGTITLVGGHGTGAAYAQRFAEVNNIQGVMELTMVGKVSIERSAV